MGVVSKLVIALWRLGLALALVVALLLVGPRLATPWIERHAEQLIARVTPDGFRVTLGELSLEWRDWGPDIRVRGLRVDSGDGDRPMLIADRFHARFDATTSLREGRLVWDGVGLQIESLSLPAQPLLAEPVVPWWIEWLQIERADVHVGELAIGDGSEWTVVSNLTGTFRLNRSRFDVRFDSADLVVGGPARGETVTLDRLAGDLFWQPRDAGWELRTAGLRVDSADLALTLQGVLRQLDGEPYFDLAADFRVPDVGRIPAYLPAGLNPGLSRWLEQALQAGRVSDGRLVLRGRAGDFPFETGSGEFRVTMQAADMMLAYHPDWPALEQLQAELDFHGRGLTIEATDGRLDGHRLLPTTATVDDLRHAHLQLSGRLESGLAGMRRTVLDSPLQDRLHAYLDPLRLDGYGELQLDLDIPLTTGEERTRVVGELSMEGADGVLEEPELVLEGLHGAVGFSDGGLEEGRFDLRIAGEPARLWIRGSDALVLQVELDARWSDDALRQTPLAPLADWLDGRSAWRVALEVPRGAAGRYRLELASDLDGSRVLLPGNLGKPAELTRPFRLQLHADSQERHWRLDHGPLRDLQLWQGADERVQRVSGTLVDVEIAGYASGSINLHGYREDNSLQLFLNGGRLRGQLAIPDRIGPQQPLWLALDRLTLTAVDNDETARTPMALPDPQRLPPVMLTVRELRWDDRELGQLTLQGQPATDGYRLEDLQLHHERHRLQLWGIWRATATTMETALQAELDSDSLGELLALFDLGGIEQAATRLRFGLRWPGSPAAMRMTDLLGEFDLQIGEGTLTAIEPGLGRLLGLFNLGSLQRRLQLDFDDLTDSGLAFDRITGRLSLQEGRLQSEDLEIVGPAARVVIGGLLDLQERRADQTVTIIPEIGMPLALAGTLAGGPVVGAAVFFADQLLKSEFDRLLGYRYSIAGDWEALQVTPIRSETTP